MTKREAKKVALHAVALEMDAGPPPSSPKWSEEDQDRIDEAWGGDCGRDVSTRWAQHPRTAMPRTQPMSDHDKAVYWVSAFLVGCLLTIFQATRNQSEQISILSKSSPRPTASKPWRTSVTPWTRT